MKRVWLGIIILLMYGCGVGGGGGTSSTGGGVQPQPPSAETGTVVVKIVRSSPQAAVEGAPQIAAALGVRPPATNVRLVVTNPTVSMTVNGTTTAFKMIIDGVLPAGDITFGLPVARGYVFQLVEYYPDTVQQAGTVPVNRILTYAKDTEDVTVSGATVTLALADVTATFTVPSPAYSGAALGAVATFQSSTPLQTGWNLKQDIVAIPYAVHFTTGAHANHTQDKTFSLFQGAPGYTGLLYLQGEFYINSSLLDTSGNLTILDPTTMTPVTHGKESVYGWTVNYPNPDFGDGQLSVTLELVPISVTP